MQCEERLQYWLLLLGSSFSNPRTYFCFSEPASAVHDILLTLKHVFPAPAGASAQPQLLDRSHLCPVHHRHHSGNMSALTKGLH